MRKPSLFYVIGEFTDEVKYCKRKGMIPYEFVDKELDGKPFKTVTKYVLKGYIYDVLVSDQCYSCSMTTLMRLPKLSFKELLNTVLTSRKQDERIGALGIILKDYQYEFEQYLTSISSIYIVDLTNKTGIERMIKTINGFIRNYSSHVRQLETIFSLCEELQFRLNWYNK